MNRRRFALVGLLRSMGYRAFVGHNGVQLRRGLPAATEVLSGLVGWWRFPSGPAGDGDDVLTAYDMSGNDINLSQISEARFEWDKLYIPDGFPGTGYLRDNKSPILDCSPTNGVTVSAWVLPYKFYVSTQQMIVWKGLNASQTQYFLYTWYGPYTEQGRVIFTDLSTGSVESTYDLNDNLGYWVHVCMTWNGAKLCLYINAVLEDENDYPGKYLREPTTGQDYLKVGAQLRCWMDDLRIYRRGLSANEVAQICAETLLPRIDINDTLIQDYIQFVEPAYMPGGRGPQEIVTGTTIGSKIPSTSSQKLGLWNTTPVDQPDAISDVSSMPDLTGSEHVYRDNLWLYLTSMKTRVEGIKNRLEQAGIIST